MSTQGNMPGTSLFVISEVAIYIIIINVQMNKCRKVMFIQYKEFPLQICFEKLGARPEDLVMYFLFYTPTGFVSG